MCELHYDTHPLWTCTSSGMCRSCRCLLLSLLLVMLSSTYLWLRWALDPIQTSSPSVAGDRVRPQCVDSVESICNRMHMPEETCGLQILTRIFLSWIESLISWLVTVFDHRAHIDIRLPVSLLVLTPISLWRVLGAHLLTSVALFHNS